MKIAFAGDFFSKSVPNISKSLLSKINECDYFIVNFEGVITTENKTRDDKSTAFNFDIENIKLFFNQFSNTPILFLCNNHIYDFGTTGAEQTLRNLKDLNKEFLLTSKELSSEVFIKCFTSDEPSVMAKLNLGNISLNNYYKKLPKDEKKGFNIAICHWGDEYVSVPHSRIQNVAKKLSENFDLIIGHHPHVIQGKEYINQSSVYYSIGNFYLDDFHYKNGAKHIFQEECYKGGIVIWESSTNTSEFIGINYSTKNKLISECPDANKLFQKRSNILTKDIKTRHIEWEESLFKSIKFKKNLLVNIRSAIHKFLKK